MKSGKPDLLLILAIVLGMGVFVSTVTHSEENSVDRSRVYHAAQSDTASENQ